MQQESGCNKVNTIDILINLCIFVLEIAQVIDCPFGENKKYRFKYIQSVFLF